MDVSIVGSFRKYYEGVKSVITLFENAGIQVLSPKKSSIVDADVEFVVFESDNQDHCPEEIELIALHRILRSDFIYTYNPEGYIGRTTCYEIGRIVERKIPIFFSDMPKDLPIFLPEETVISPEKLIAYYQKHGRLPQTDGTASTAFAKQLHENLFSGDYYE